MVDGLPRRSPQGEGGWMVDGAMVDDSPFTIHPSHVLKEKNA
jgi:hypothetical protein